MAEYKLLSKYEYERDTAATRDERMAWWRAARFGMFIHYGLYSQLGRNEWAMAFENFELDEYEKLADNFHVKEGAAREWAKLAKDAGMKYVVLTTRHHDGFSLWDSKANPYNSVNYGCKRDIIREFVDACREYDLKIGFYTTLIDWHHPDSFLCGRDSNARRRFTDYTYELNRELMTNYGKIDILWYDMAWPMDSSEGWNSLEMNQMIRQLQPHIIINNRSRLDEDFGTPEGSIKPMERDWEACMTFNDLSWGYVDSEQALPYSYSAQRIIRMVSTVTRSNGNLLLNIGPTPDGSVPAESIKPLTQVGRWLKEHSEAIYGESKRVMLHRPYGAANSYADGKTAYNVHFIWPKDGEIVYGGIMTKLKSARILNYDGKIEFEQVGHRIYLRNLPPKCPDSIAGIAVTALEFEKAPDFSMASYYPQLNGGMDKRGIQV